MKLRFSVNCILYRRKMPGITQVLNLYVTHIKFLRNASFLRKLNPLNFRPLLSRLTEFTISTFEKNSAESYDFFLARAYRARTQVIFN